MIILIPRGFMECSRVLKTKTWLTITAPHILERKTEFLINSKIYMVKFYIKSQFLHTEG